MVAELTWERWESGLFAQFNPTWQRPMGPSEPRVVPLGDKAGTMREAGGYMDIWIGISKPRVWLHRIPRILAAVFSSAVLSLISASILENPAGVDLGLAGAMLAGMLGCVAGTTMALQVNRMGIYETGFAPPTKPLNGITSKVWVLPWEDLTEVQMIHRHLSPADMRKGVTLRVVSSTRRMEWLLDGDRLPRWFGDPTQGKRFVAVLDCVGVRLRELGRPLSSEEASRIVNLVPIQG